MGDGDVLKIAGGHQVIGPTPAHGHAVSDVADLVTDLGNKADGTHGHAEDGITGLLDSLAAKASADNTKLLYKFTFDQANGNGTGSHNMVGVAIPSGFVIQNATLEITEGFVGGALATAALSSGEGAGDLVVATVITGPPWSTTGFKVTIPLLGTVLTWIKTTQARIPAIVVGVAALSAGKCNLYLEGIMA